MPSAQRVLAQAGIAAADVKGTGPGGRVLKEDAERAEKDLDADEEGLKKNVECVVRLEEMDLSELQGLPLPKNCPGNCDGLRKKKGRCTKGKCKGKGKGEKDSREKIFNTGAGALRKKGSGS